MAGKPNAYLSKAVKMIDRLSGGAARDWKITSDTLNKQVRKNKSASPLRAERMARVESGRTFQARAKTGVVGSVAAAGGFLGLHKYHQHKDNQILKKIDSMYNNSDWQN